MKPRRLSTLLVALALALPAVVMADPGGNSDYGHGNGNGNGNGKSHARQGRPDWDHPGFRHDESRGAGPSHDWKRGGRLPAEYRSKQYVVDDWRGHHLSAPPRGYHWVQASGDYVLAAVATGIILDTLLSN